MVEAARDVERRSITGAGRAVAHGRTADVRPRHKEDEMADRSLAGRAKRLEEQVEHARRKANEWAARAESAAKKLETLRREAAQVAGG